MTLAVGHGGCAVALLRLRFGGGGMRLSDYRNGLGEGFAQRTRSSGHFAPADSPRGATASDQSTTPRWRFHFQPLPNEDINVP